MLDLDAKSMIRVSMINIDKKMISDDKWSHLHIVVATSGNILLNNLDLAIGIPERTTLTDKPAQLSGQRRATTGREVPPHCVVMAE